MSERPGPEVAVIALTPAKDAPMTAPIAASSSSVTGEEAAPGMERPHGRGLVSREKEPARAGCVSETLAGDVLAERACESETGFERFRVGLPDCLLLAAESVMDGPAHDFDGKPEEASQDSERDDVLGSGRAARLPREPVERDRDPKSSVVHVEVELLGRRRVRRLVKENGVLRHFDLTAETHEVRPPEDHKDVDRVCLREELARSDANRAGGLTPADLWAITLGLDDVKALARGGHREEIAHGHHAIASGTHDRDRQIVP